jgi:spermidine/putrescine transport system permease protein
MAVPQSTAAESRLPERPVARLWWLLPWPTWIWLLLFSFLPLAIVVALSFTRRGSPITWEFTLENYARLADPLLFPIIRRSLWLACVTTVGCLAAGYPLAYFIVQRPPRLRAFLYVLTLLPLWSNSLVLAYAWMVLLRVDGLADHAAHVLGWLPAEESLNWLYTPGAVVIGMIYWYLPFMVYPLYAALEKFDWTLLDAAMDLGSTRLMALWKILLRLTWPGVMAGSLLVFIPALSNFVIPQLLGGAKAALIGNVIQERFLSQPQDWPFGAALALAMMLLIAIAIWLYFKAERAGGPIG